MLFQTSCQVLLLWAAFLLQDILGFCERPAWASVGWDLTQKELEPLPTKEQSNCFHKSICQICRCFTGMGLSKRCPEIIYTSCKAVLIIVICLSIFYLLSKLKRIKNRKAMIQTSAVSISPKVDEENTHNIMINKLVANTSKIKKYMKCIAHHERTVKYRKLNRKGWGNNSEFSQVCSNNHSSSEVTTMHDF